MRKAFLLFMLALPAVIVFAQQDSAACLSFRRGDFTYSNESGQLVYIKRTARIQQETIKETGTLTRHRVKWLSACAYQITQTWSNKKALRKNNGASTVVYMLSTAKYSYQFSCACKGSSATNLTGIVYRRNADL